MNAVDFFLYDNQTPSEHGRDWGLKAATGELAVDKDLQRRFLGYCRLLFDTRHGIPQSFDYAVGGMPVGQGYLLCLTFESLDLQKRASCTVVGLWFPQPTPLRDFLRDGDLRATARGVLGQERLSDRLLLLRAEKPQADSQQQSVEPVRFLPLMVGRFTVAATPAWIVDFLLGRLRRREPLPTILGITSLPNLERMAAARIEIAFFKDEGDSAVSVLQSVAASPPTTGLVKRSWQRLFGLIGSILPLVLGAVALCWWILQNSREALQEPEFVLPPEAASFDLPLKPVLDAEEFLHEVGKQVELLENLDPAVLLETSSYQRLLSEPAAKELDGRRSVLLQAIVSDLPAARKAVVDPLGENMLYFFHGKALQLPTTERAQAVQDKLQKLRPLAWPCRELGQAFPSELDDPSSPLAAWCRCLQTLDEMAVRRIS